MASLPGPSSPLAEMWRTARIVLAWMASGVVPVSAESVKLSEGDYVDEWGVTYRPSVEPVAHPVRGAIATLQDARAYVPRSRMRRAGWASFLNLSVAARASVPPASTIVPPPCGPCI